MPSPYLMVRSISILRKSNSSKTGASSTITRILTQAAFARAVSTISFVTVEPLRLPTILVMIFPAMFARVHAGIADEKGDDPLFAGHGTRLDAAFFWNALDDKHHERHGNDIGCQHRDQKTQGLVCGERGRQMCKGERCQGADTGKKKCTDKVGYADAGKMSAGLCIHMFVLRVLSKNYKYSITHFV